MNQAKKYIKELISIEKKYKSEHAFFISFYLPVKVFNRKEIKTTIKSKLLTNFKKHDQIKKHNDIQHKFIDSINLLVDEIDDLPNSFGIFGVIDLKNDNPHRIDYLSEQRIKLFPLLYVKEKVMISSIFDISKLVMLQNFNSEYLIFNISQKKCQIFELKDVNVKKIKTIENKYSYKLSDDNKMAKFSPQKGNSITYHTGEKENNELEELNKKFVRDIKIEAKTFLTNKQIKINNIFIFHTENLTRYQDFIDKEFSNIFKGQTNISLIEKNLNLEKDINKHVNKLIQKKFHTYKLNALKNAKNDYKNYITNWNDIIKALRESRVSILFYNSHFQKIGFLKDELPFAIAKAESEKQEDIIPFLIRIVYKQEGNVIVFQDQDVFESIAVKLRF